MEIGIEPTERHNKALDLYRHEKEERMKKFTDAYRAWSEISEGSIWYFRARAEAWERYLEARREWTGF